MCAHSTLTIIHFKSVLFFPRFSFLFHLLLQIQMTMCFVKCLAALLVVWKRFWMYSVGENSANTRCLFIPWNQLMGICSTSTRITMLSDSCSECIKKIFILGWEFLILIFVVLVFTTNWSDIRWIDDMHMSNNSFCSEPWIHYNFDLGQNSFSRTNKI